LISPQILILGVEIESTSIGHTIASERAGFEQKQGGLGQKKKWRGWRPVDTLFIITLKKVINVESSGLFQLGN
jgi:hypothetical protein